MDKKEIRKLTKERLKNIKVVSAKLTKYKRNLEEAEKLGDDSEYISKLHSEILDYEMELMHIKNAMEPLEDREKQIIVLNLFEKVTIENVISQLNLSRTQVNRLKTKAIDTIGEILYC